MNALVPKPSADPTSPTGPAEPRRPRCWRCRSAPAPERRELAAVPGDRRCATRGVLRRERADLLHLNNSITRTHDWMLARHGSPASRASCTSAASTTSSRSRRAGSRPGLAAVLCISQAAHDNLVGARLRPRQPARRPQRPRSGGGRAVARPTAVPRGARDRRTAHRSSAWSATSASGRDRRCWCGRCRRCSRARARRALPARRRGDRRATRAYMARIQQSLADGARSRTSSSPATRATSADYLQLSWTSPCTRRSRRSRSAASCSRRWRCDKPVVGSRDGAVPRSSSTARPATRSRRATRTPLAARHSRSARAPGSRARLRRGRLPPARRRVPRRSQRRADDGHLRGACGRRRATQARAAASV